MPKLRVARLALVSFVGALVLEIVLTFALGLREAFTISQVPAHLAALLVGGLAGWLFELLREMTAVTAEMLSSAQNMQARYEALTDKIQYQEKALDMLIACPRHNAALTRLIKTSISVNFKSIPLVAVSDYLAYLRQAIVHSDGYEGISRNTLSWFRDAKRGAYLNNLRQRNMQYKTRLFIINEENRAQWNADLNDLECQQYYWRNTGNVETFWMLSENFRDNFPSWGDELPKDFALYDRQLLISYDERMQLLYFDVFTGESRESALFKSIRQMVQDEMPIIHRLQPFSNIDIGS
jgi:hypothetical protein